MLNSLAKNLMIHLGIEFDRFIVTINSATLTTILAMEIPINTKPILQFDLSSNFHLPSLKKESSHGPHYQFYYSSTSTS